MEIPEHLVNWYHQKIGRTPSTLDEVEVLWNQEFLQLNPHERKYRELVVEYAESRGGNVLNYLRAFYPDYWGLPASERRQSSLEATRVSKEERDSIFVEMMETVWPAYESSPEYLSSPRTPDSLRFPKTEI